MKEICEVLLNDVYEASCRLADESDYEDDLLPKLKNINTFIHTIGHYWDNLPENVQSDIMSEFVKHVDFRFLRKPKSYKTTEI